MAPGWLLPGLLNTALAMALLLALLLLGTVLGKGLGLHRWGIPEALIAGTLGLLLAPGGALPLLPEAVIQLWDQLPLILLTLVFAGLLLGKPLPGGASLWRPLTAQVLLALTLGCGQYLVAGLAVWLVLQPLLGVSPVMACLIEVAFEGGHGSAAAMGPTYERLGVAGGETLGLAMATVGLLASTVVGGVLVVLARRLGWLATPRPADGAAGADATDGADAAPPPTAASAATTAAATSTDAAGIRPPALRAAGVLLSGWLVNLGLAGIAVALGWSMLEGLRWWLVPGGGLAATVVTSLPVFPLALLGSLIVRLLLERTGLAGLASSSMQSRMGTLSADLLIAAATACLDLSLLAEQWLPLLVLALAGLIWNLAVVLLLGRAILPAPWFERTILEFGQATGVAASGLLLLQMADPEDRGQALPPFSIKQLLMQPLLAGGVVTVLAPLAVSGLGLPVFIGLALVLVLLWGGLGLALARVSPGAAHPG
jgi:ESS family glutamate:Na+ symporter